MPKNWWENDPVAAADAGADGNWWEGDPVAAEAPPQKERGVTGVLADVGKSLGGSVVSALGTVPKATGRVLREAGEKAFGVTMDEAQRMAEAEGAPDKALEWYEKANRFNPASLAGRGVEWIGDRVLKAGDDIRGSRSAAAQEKARLSTPDGDITKPSTWTVGQDPSIEGAAHVLSDVVGSMAPPVAAAVATRGRSAATQMAVGGATGAAQIGGAAMDEARDYLGSMSDDELAKASPVYRSLLASGLDKVSARTVLMRRAENAAASLAAPVGAVGGKATAAILGKPGETLASKLPGMGGKAAVLGALGATEEGLQEVGEGIATRAGINEAAGTERSLTDGTFAEAILGAKAGGTVGAVRGAMSGVKTDGGVDEQDPAQGAAAGAAAGAAQGTQAPAAAGGDGAAPAGPAVPDQRRAATAVPATGVATSNTDEAERALRAPVQLTALDRADELGAELARVDARLAELAPENGYGPAFDAERAELQQAAEAARAERDAIAQTWPTAIKGMPTTFSTEAGVKLDGEYALVDADELVTSHDENLRANPLFPAELQPRDRSRSASELQVSGIVQKLEPARLGVSADAATGAPIVGADGLVESGNARTIALKRVYRAQGQKAEDYKAWLRRSAEQFGITPEAVDGMRKPVLVRVRSTPVNRAEFARQANQSTIQRMSPSEQAMADAKRLASLEGLNPDDNGDFTSSHDFIRQFMATLPITEQADMIESDGRLSTTGYRRMQNAVLAKAYGDSPTLRRMTESLDNNLVNISKALTRSAPVIASARDRIAAGGLFDADISGELVQAVEGLSAIKDKGWTVAQELGQTDLTGPKYSPEAAELLQFLADNVRSPRRIAEFLQRYYEALEAAGDPNQGSLLGETVAPERAALMQQARGGEDGQQASAGSAAEDRQQPQDAQGGGQGAGPDEGRTGQDASAGQQSAEGGAAESVGEAVSAGNVEPAQAPVKNVAPRTADRDFWAYAKEQGHAPKDIAIGSELHTRLKAEFEALKAGKARLKAMTGAKLGDEWRAFAKASGALGVPRADMPQIKAEHRGALTQFLAARGITHQAEADLDATTLRPTQVEYSPAKVKAAQDYEGGERSILISADSYVLDGHHQWLAKLGQGLPIRAIRFDAPMAELLPLAREFPSAGVADGAALTAPTVADIEAQQDRAAQAEALDQRAQVQRESEAGAGLFELVREDGRQDMTGDIFTQSAPQAEPATSDDGPFGPMFTGYTNNPEAAIAKLMKEKRGEVADAFLHPEIGSIAFVYGDDAMGLRHIEKKRGIKWVEKIPEILRSGRFERDPDPTLQRAYIVQDAEPANVTILRLDWDGRQKTWLVTAHPDNKGKWSGANKTSRTAGDDSGQVQGNPSQSSPQADSIDAADGGQPQKEASAPRQKAARPADERIEDVGEQLYANRRNFTGRGLKWEDVEGLNDTLKIKEVTKAKVWPRPNYEQLVADGMPTILARMVKQVYDGISAGPTIRADAVTDEQLKRYIDTLAKIREGLFGFVNDKQAVGQFASSVLALSNGSRSMTGPISIIDMMKSDVDAKAVSEALLRRVWPEEYQGSMRPFARGTQANGELAIIGGNKALTALQFVRQDFAKWAGDMGKGWPGKREAWEVQGYRVLAPGEYTAAGREQADGTTRMTIRAKEGRGSWQASFTAEQLADAPFVLVQDGGFGAKTFATREAAAEAAREKVKRKAGAGQDIRGTNIEAAERTGPARREEGEDVNSQRLMDTFGFRGVNFGREGWINQTERQAYLNQAYDGLMDLADILGVPAKAMSLNGELGIAFGAQGKGKFAAHFVPGVNEINLTKTKGAGTLAHEWGHALDHHFAKQAGLAKEKEPFLSEHAYRPDTGNRMVFEGGRYVSKKDVPTFGDGIRPEIVRAFREVYQAMQKRDTSPAEAQANDEAMRASALKRLNGWIAAARREIEGSQAENKDDLLAEFDQHAEKLREGDTGDGYEKAGKQTYSVRVAAIRNLIKDATGRMWSADETKGLESNAGFVRSLMAKQDADRKHEPQKVSTQYKRDSAAMDAEKGGKAYWSTPAEMFARAFELYVHDKLAQKDALNTFLTDADQRASTPAKVADNSSAMARASGATRDLYLYPTGQERDTLRGAFDNLVGTIESRETDKGVVLYDIAGLQEDGPISRLPETPRANVLARLKALEKRRTENKIGEVEYRAGVQTLIEQIAQRNDTRLDRSISKGRERGPDWVKERLIRAKRKGELDTDTVDFALWALAKNPALAEDLGIGVREQPEGQVGAAGDYNPASRVMRLFKGAAQETTAVHEILHHTERMMPVDVQNGILKAYQKAWGEAYQKADDKTRALLQDMLLAQAGDAKAMKRVRDGFGNGALKYEDHYQLYNASEFWAVNATDILAKRYAVDGSWVGRAKRWLAEMLQYVKGALGLSSDVPVLRGLRVVLDGTGERLTNKMLSGRDDVLQQAGGPGNDPPLGERQKKWVQDQKKWLQVEARARGFKDIADLLARDPALFEKLAALWRKKNPAEVLPSRAAPPAGAQPKTATERAEALIQKRAGGAAPLDRLAKLSTRVTGVDRLTGAIYDKAGDLLARLTPEKIKAGLVSDYGVPEAVIDQRVMLQGRQRVQLRKVGSLIEKLSTLTREESRVAYEWMNMDGSDPKAYLSAMQGLPEESVRVLQDVQKMIDDLSQEAVRLGQLDPESFKRNRFAYLRRSYAKHILDQTAGDKAKRSRVISILGDQYKGRGLVQAEPMAKMQAAAPDWWGRKLVTGKADTALKGQKFIRLEKRTLPGQASKALDGMAPAGAGRVQAVTYWPADLAVPRELADWMRADTWEVRDVKGGNVVLWRDFTKEEREKMGEVDEARFAIAKTLQAMVHDVEVGRYLEWLGKNYAKAEGQAIPGVVVEASERMRDTFAPNEWVKVPDTKIPGTGVLKYGKLAGKYLPGPVWNDLRQVVAGGQFKPFGETYATVLRWWKTSKTALSPGVHMNNVMSNMVMADWHDVRAAHVAKALRIMLAASGTKGGIADKEAAQEVLNRYKDSGGDIGTFATQEIAREQIDPLLKALEAELAITGAGAAAQAGVYMALQHALGLRFPEAWEALKSGRTGKAAAKAGGALIDLYQAEDDVFRLAAWLKAKEDGVDDLAAGKMARRSFLDYNINAPWVQAMRASAWPFISFTYRAVPMLAEIAGKKPHKLMKLMMLAGGLNALGVLMGGGGDDERKLLPEEKAGSIWGLVPKLMRMPWNDDHGSPVYLDIRRWIPVGDVFDVGAGNAAIPMFPGLMPGGPLVLAGEVVLNKSAFTGKAITQETDTGAEKAAKLGDYLYKAFAPNLLGLPNTYATEGVAGSLTGRTDAFGREMSTPQAMASAVGVKLGSYPADVLRRNLTAEARAQESEIQRNIGQLKRQYATGRISKQEFDEAAEAQNQKLRELGERLRDRLN